ATEDSPSGRGRTLGKRVRGNSSGVQIPHPPPRRSTMFGELHSPSPQSAVPARGDDPPDPPVSASPTGRGDGQPCSVSFTHLPPSPQYPPGGTTPRTPRCRLRRRGAETALTVNHGRRLHHS